MSELIINKPEDIEKLKGWTILEAEVIASPLSVRMKMSHPAAGKIIQITIIARNTMVLSGDTVRAVAGLTIESSDIEF